MAILGPGRTVTMEGSGSPIMEFSSCVQGKEPQGPAKLFSPCKAPVAATAFQFLLLRSVPSSSARWLDVLTPLGSSHRQLR